MEAIASAKLSYINADASQITSVSLTLFCSAAPATSPGAS